MREWDIWAWMAYGALAVTALLLASDQAIKASSELSSKFRWITKKSAWGFAPGILMLFATILFILNLFGVLTFNSSHNEEHLLAKWPDNYQAVPVIGKTFRNERVILDGKFFSNCTFENVTFVYNGTTPIQMSNTRITGSKWFASDNPAVAGTLALMVGFGLIPKDTKIEAGSNHIEWPTITTKPRE